MTRHDDATQTVIATCAHVACLLVSPLAGCGYSSRASPPLDLAEYATAHQRVPKEFLARAGAPDRFDHMPFICGTPMMAAMDEFEKSFEGQPMEVKKQAMDELAKQLASSPRPEPDYTVDLTQVAEVRTVWVGGKRITILRHPAVTPKGEPVWHEAPTNRVYVEPEHAAGEGPVSIWQGNEFLHFEDGAWILMDVGRSNDPSLLLLQDHYDLGGPIEGSFFSSLGKERKGILGNYAYFFWDSEVTGDVFRVRLDNSRTPPALRMDRRHNGGPSQEYGVIEFDQKRSAYEFRKILQVETDMPGDGPQTRPSIDGNL
jgi:hypothetical protein